MERIFDSPRRVRFVAANVAASDTVKGSHIQRNPLSMGALAEPEEWPRVSQSPKEKKRRDCVMTARLTLSGMQQRKLAHSCEVGSYPSRPGTDDEIDQIRPEIQRYVNPYPFSHALMYYSTTGGGMPPAIAPRGPGYRS
jgi:hypothetical protein